MDTTETILGWIVGIGSALGLLWLFSFSGCMQPKLDFSEKVTIYSKVQDASDLSNHVAIYRLDFGSFRRNFVLPDNFGNPGDQVVLRSKIAE